MMQDVMIPFIPAWVSLFKKVIPYHRWASKFAAEGGHKLSFAGGGHKNFAPGGGRGGSVDENFGTFS